MTQLAEWLLPIPEIQGSNPVIGKILFWTYLLLTVEKTKIVQKEAWIGPFKNVHYQTKEKQEEGQDEDPDPDDKMQRHHPHV